MTDVEETYLVTTAIKDTWPISGRVDLLGTWCQDQTENSSEDVVETRIVPYHWDNRERLFQDYLYLKGLHENILAELRDQLNQYHGVERSVGYWRIILGPWLIWILPILLDRWISIDEYQSADGPCKTIVLTERGPLNPPNDMIEFMSLAEDPYWNHCLYNELIAHHPEIEREWVARQDLDPVGPSTTINEIKPTTYQRLWGYLEKISKRVTSRDKIVMISTYLSRREEMRLCFRLSQLPMTRRTVQAPKVDWDPESRDWALPGRSDSLFEDWIRVWIPKNLPRIYLEGYSELIGAAKAMNWPTEPDLIWTSVAYNSDEVFKAWAAECVETGTSLVVGQHGGFNGLGKWSSTEDHEVLISDRYLSWGWADGNDKRVSPVGILRPKAWLELGDREPRNALMVLGAGPKYAYRMYATPVAGQWDRYFNNQCRFIQSLPEEVRGCLVVRPDPTYAGRNGRDQIVQENPDVVIDDGIANIREQLQGTRLLISTYHGSTMLEAIAMNIPTVMMLDPSMFEFRDSAMDSIKQLIEVGIFHETLESATNHISRIWSDVEGWWDLDTVQVVRNRFAEHYARRPEELLTEIEISLRDVIVRNIG